MAKKNTRFRFNNENGGFDLTINNPVLGKKIADICQEELEKPIPPMKEYYALQNNMMYPKEQFDGQEEIECVLDCCAGGLVKPCEACPKDKDITDPNEFATVNGTCSLMGENSGKPCKLAYEQNLVCKIHYYMKLKSKYVGKANKQKELI